MIGLASDLTEEETAEQTVEITNLGACREHLYLPYALHDSSLLSADVIGDAEVKKNEENWTISYLSGSVPQWYAVLQKLADHQKADKEQEYLRCEDAYRKYVYDKDLQITDTAAATLGRLLPPAEGRLKLSEIKERIYQCLEENLAYDESAVTLNGNNDFLAYTLEQKKKGYSVHYATATVLMLRYYGVPAGMWKDIISARRRPMRQHREKNWCWMRPMRMRGQSIIWTVSDGFPLRQRLAILIRKRSESARILVWDRILTRRRTRTTWRRKNRIPWKKNPGTEANGR